MSVHIAIPEPASPRHVDDAIAYNQRALPQYLHALYSAGATPIPVPLHESPQRIAKILSTCQGILLPGSPADIDPQKYSEPVLPECGRPDPDRAAVDELLIQDAFNLHKPILAICQGMQALNVWCNGSLFQDIPTQVGATVNHDPGRNVLEAHPLEITPGTRLSFLASQSHGLAARSDRELPFRAPHPTDHPALQLREDPGHLYVNSSHHQCVHIPGNNLTVSAISPEDGIVEAVELASSSQFVIAVQWHPERTYDVSALSRALFSSFVHAAEAWSSRRVEESVLHA